MSEPVQPIALYRGAVTKHDGDPDAVGATYRRAMLEAGLLREKCSWCGGDGDGSANKTPGLLGYIRCGDCGGTGQKRIEQTGLVAELLALSDVAPSVPVQSVEPPTPSQYAMDMCTCPDDACRGIGPDINGCSYCWAKDVDEACPHSGINYNEDDITEDEPEPPTWEELGATLTEDGEWEWRYDLDRPPFGSGASVIVTDADWENPPVWFVGFWHPHSETLTFQSEEDARRFVADLQAFSALPSEEKKP